MNKKSFFIALVLCTSILLSACGAGSKQTSSQARPTIKVFMTDRSDAPLNNDLPVLQKIEEKCNVDIELELAPSVNTAERFNMLMASGELPDIVIYNLDDLYKYTRAFEPLDELLDKYGPNIKKAIDADENSKRDLTAIDGKTYAIPMISAVKTSQVFFARQDWLDKLNIPQPKTLDDYYNMLKAFKEKDPNGNGQADEIPFTTRSKKDGLMVFSEAFGIKEEFFLENNTIKYGAIDPRMKDVLTYLNKLYSEKLIDQEYLTIDSKQWQARVSNEQSGVLQDWVSRIDFFNNMVTKTNPKANFAAILPPTLGDQPASTTYQMRRVRDGGAAAISKSSKNKEAIMKMYNYIFSDEGILLTNFGVENEDYTLKDSQPVYTDSILKNPDGKSPQIALWSKGITLDWPMKQDIRYEKQFLSKQANEARDMYEPIIAQPFPKLKFTDDERTQINAKMGDIKTYKDEMLDKFITGAEPLSNFDQFVQKVNSMGINEVIQIYNTSYQRYIQ